MKKHIPKNKQRTKHSLFSQSFFNMFSAAIS